MKRDRVGGEWVGLWSAAATAELPRMRRGSWFKVDGKRMRLTVSGLAQSVERLTAEREVAGSNPGAGPLLRVLK